MGLRDIAPQIEYDNYRRVQAATWGHLAPVKDRTYRGRIVFAIGCYDSGDLNPTPLLVELRGLDSSPWFYQALHEFLSDLTEDPPVKDPRGGRGAKDGCVFEWNGSFCNYEFVGTIKLLLDPSARTCPLT